MKSPQRTIDPAYQDIRYDPEQFCLVIEGLAAETRAFIHGHTAKPAFQKWLQAELAEIEARLWHVHDRVIGTAG